MVKWSGCFFVDVLFEIVLFHLKGVIVSRRIVYLLICFSFFACSKTKFVGKNLPPSSDTTGEPEGPDLLGEDVRKSTTENEEVGEHNSNKFEPSMIESESKPGVGVDDSVDHTNSIGDPDPTKVTEPTDGEDPIKVTEPTDGEDPVKVTEPTDGEDPIKVTEPTDGEDPIKVTEPTDKPDPKEVVNPVETIVNLCKSSPHSKFMKKFQFPKQVDCEFGKYGNLNGFEAHLQAQKFQNRSFSLPENAVLCGIKLESMQSNIRYDDFLLFTLNDYIYAEQSRVIGAN